MDFELRIAMAPFVSEMTARSYADALAAVDLDDAAEAPDAEFVQIKAAMAAALAVVGMYRGRTPCTAAAAAPPPTAPAANPDFLALCRLLAPVLEGAARGVGISGMECAALAERVLDDLRGGAAAGVAA